MTLNLNNLEIETEEIYELMILNNLTFNTDSVTPQNLENLDIVIDFDSANITFKTEKAKAFSKNIK